MAYNPTLYSPYGQPQPYTWSQPVWQASPQQVSNQPINGLVSVTGAEGAKAYPLPPNSSMPLFDANEDVMYVKTTDGAGFPTVKAYRFEQVEAPEAQAPQYATREDFERLEKRIEQLASRREAGHAKQSVSEPAGE